MRIRNIAHDSSTNPVIPYDRIPPQCQLTPHYFGTLAEPKHAYFPDTMFGRRRWITDLARDIYLRRLMQEDRGD
jgi:hypothetical protein